MSDDILVGNMLPDRNGENVARRHESSLLHSLKRYVARALGFLRRRHRPGSAQGGAVDAGAKPPGDPYAWRPVPRRPRPDPRSGAVAVAEPDE